VPKYHIYQETTKWTDGSTANHVYVFSDRPSGRTAKALGYIRQGEQKVFRFKNPLTLDLRGRTFEALK
jgi:hypothetical protein